MSDIEGKMTKIKQCSKKISSKSYAHIFCMIILVAESIDYLIVILFN